MRETLVERRSGHERIGPALPGAGLELGAWMWTVPGHLEFAPIETLVPAGRHVRRQIIQRLDDHVVLAVDQRAIAHDGPPPLRVTYT